LIDTYISNPRKEGLAQYRKILVAWGRKVSQMNQGNYQKKKNIRTCSDERGWSCSKIPARLVVRNPCVPIIRPESIQSVFIIKLPFLEKEGSLLVCKTTSETKFL
jgi:hypothetical protein